MLPDALSRSAGFSAYDDLGSAFKTTMVSRGFSSSPVVGLPQGVSVLIDGIPLNEPDAGQVNFDVLPVSLVDRIEVLRGTASLLGPNSLGGAVNLVTRGGGDVSSELEVSAGSQDHLAISGSSATQLGRFNVIAGAGHIREKGWRDLTAARQSNVFVRIGHSGEQQGLALLAFGARSYAETAGSLPLSVYASRPDSNLSAGDFEDLEQLHIALSGYRRVGTGRASLSLWGRAHDAERFNVNQIDDPDVRGFSRNRTLGMSGDWAYSTSTAAGEMGFRFGGTGTLNDVGIRLFGERIDPGLTTDVKSPIRELGAHVSADLRSGPLTVAIGARVDNIRVPFRNLLRPERDTVSVYRHLSPRAGVSLEVSRGLDVYASAARSFRAPAVIELACADPEEPCPLPFALGDDPPLDAVVATTLESGARYSSGILSAQATVFRTNVRDDIFLFPYRDEDEPDGSTIDGFFANIPQTRRVGAEVETRLTMSRLQLNAGYTFTRATFESSGFELFSIRESDSENEIDRGDRLPLVPAHTLALGASLSLESGFDVSANVIAIGDRVMRGDEANEDDPLPGFVRTDLRVGYQRDRWTAHAALRNLFDRRYAVFGTFNVNQGAGHTVERFLTPAEPRAFTLSLSVRF